MTGGGGRVQPRGRVQQPGTETGGLQFCLWRNVTSNHCQRSRTPAVPSLAKKHIMDTFIVAFPNCRSSQLMCPAKAPGM